MRLLITEKQKVAYTRPTRLEVMTEFHKRGDFRQVQAFRDEFTKLKRGAEGEQLLYDYLESYGAEHWVILRNVWLNFFGGFECDALVLTRAGVYPFEVKNYSGTFVLENNVGQINGVTLGKHPVTQGLNVKFSMQAMFERLNPPPKVTTAVLFIGSDNQVDIRDEVHHLKVLQRNQLKDYIWEIKQTERYYQGAPLDVEDILSVLDAHEIPTHYPPEVLADALRAGTRSGMMCAGCGGFEVEVNYKYVVCACGMHESRDEAIVRTVCEYGVMHFDRNLTTTEIVDFIGASVSRSNVTRVLKQYFGLVGSHRGSRVVNTGLPFSRMYQQFEFKTPKYKIITGLLQ